jgi:hypothetical protein
LSKQQGALMTNRREILQGGIALTSLPLAAHATWATTESDAYASHALYRILFDHRFSESRAFGEEAQRLGGIVRGFAGDITDLWYHELDERWRAGPAAIAGLTRHGPLFCLERLAWNAGMRVVYRATHVADRDGSTAHFLAASQPMLSIAVGLHTQESDWARCAARAVIRCPIDATSKLTTLALPATAHKPEDAGDPLISWIIAPRARRQGA